jgi:hypothetical protein
MPLVEPTALIFARDSKNKSLPFVYVGQTEKLAGNGESINTAEEPYEFQKLIHVKLLSSPSSPSHSSSSSSTSSSSSSSSSSSATSSRQIKVGIYDAAVASTEDDDQETDNNKETKSSTSTEAQVEDRAEMEEVTGVGKLMGWAIFNLSVCFAVPFPCFCFLSCFPDLSMFLFR